MDINNKTRIMLRMQGISFVVLVLIVAGLLFGISREYNKEFDWTASGRHSLNQASIKVLEKLDAPVKITCFAASNETSDARLIIHELVKRYQNKSDLISLEFINPRLEPNKVRDMGITTNGEMVIEYKGRSLHLQQANEKSLSNLLEKLMRNTDRQIIFVTGHGERNPLTQANHDYSIFADNLSNKGFKVNTLDLGKMLAVPVNTSVLVIASPQVDYLPGEVKLIQEYVEKGGNLLWLIEPEKPDYLKPLANFLKLNITHGTVVDLDMSLMGNAATFVLGDYLQHEITNSFSATNTVYPGVIGIEVKEQEGWHVAPLVQSMPRSWLETGAMKGTIKFDPEQDKSGPIIFGQAITRTKTPAQAEKKDEAKEASGESPNAEQRIVVMGDGDFISNTYLGTQGNMAMGESLMNWLAFDDNFIDIPPSVAPDSKIQINEIQLLVIGGIFIILLPILLIGSGVVIWLKRRKK